MFTFRKIILCIATIIIIVVNYFFSTLIAMFVCLPNTDIYMKYYLIHLGTITLIHIANKAENDCAKNGDRIRMNKPSESSQRKK